MSFYLYKMYIKRQIINEKTIYFNYFLNELNFKLDIVKSICETNNTLTPLQQEMGHHPRLTLIFTYLIDSIKLFTLFIVFSLNIQVYLWYMPVSK